MYFKVKILRLRPQLVMRTVIILIAFCFTSLTIQAHPGIGLVYDGNQTIYYTDLTHVWKLDTKSGRTEIFIENVHTHELFLDKDGNLFGEHYWYVNLEKKFKNYIWRVSKEEEFQKIRDDEYGENYDFGFVRDKSFASYKIQQQNEHYRIIKKDSLNETVLHTLKLNHPSWKYMTQDNELLFVDFPSVYSSNKDQIGIIVEDVSSSRFPFSHQSDDHNIYGLWTDQAGSIYVAIYGGREVKKSIKKVKQVDS